jgi:hypothetical protein
MSLVTVFNTTDRPVVLDAEGREVGGGEWGTADSTAEAAKAGLEPGGGLVRAEIPDTGDVNPQARAAAERTARLAERHTALTALDPKVLDRLAAKAGLPEGNKTDLVRSLAFREDVAVPGTATAKES